MNDHQKAHLDDECQPVSSAELDVICDVLGDIIGEGIDVHRCLAARAVGHIGAEGSVKPLIGALLDEDEDVRTDAAEALSRLADPTAGEQLLENLIGDPCTDVKLAAIDALVKSQDRRAIPWLRKMVRGRDDDIAWDDDEFYASGWDCWVDVQKRAVEALAELHAAEAVPEIVAATGDEDAQDLCETALNSLVAFGPPGIAALSQFLDEGNERMRRRVASALSGADVEDAAALLARTFGDSSPEVRSAAMHALAAYAPADERLAAMFEDSDAGIRAQAVRLCGTRYPDRLPELINDTADTVQIAALNTLSCVDGLIGDVDLAASVYTKLHSETASVAAASAQAYSVLLPHAAQVPLIELVTDTGHSVEKRLGALRGLAAIGGDAAVDAFVDLITDSERQVRIEAMSALAKLACGDRIWPNPAGEALLVALGVEDEVRLDDDEPEAEVDEPATKADETASTSDSTDKSQPEIDERSSPSPTSTLGAILDDKPEIREFVGLPDDGVELSRADMERLAIAKNIKGKKRIPLTSDVSPDEDIRRISARVLGDLDHEDVVHALIRAVNDPDVDVRMAAADSLARIGMRSPRFSDEIAESLLVATGKAKPDLRFFLIRALAACPNNAVRSFLQEQTENDDSVVRAEAVRALSRQGEVGSLIERLLTDPDPIVRESAAEAMAKVDDRNVVGRLVDFAFSFEGYHGRFAARLLRDLDAAAASALFVDVLRDPERIRFWAVAIEALEELNRSQVNESGQTAIGQPENTREEYQ